MKRFLEILRNNSSLVIALATVVLAAITFFYLLETRSLRQIAEDSLMINTSPKVFLKKISSTPRLNKKKRAIVVTLVLEIVNTGKTEAKDLMGNYTISSGNTKVEDKFGPVQYLFPSQVGSYETKMLTVILDEKQFEIVRKAIKLGKPLIVSPKLVNPIYFRLNLSYLNQI